VEEVNARGLLLEKGGTSVRVPMRASTSADVATAADLVLFCVKSGDTESAGRELAPHLPAGAVVLSLQNGVDNAERLAAVLGREVIPAIVYVGCEMAGPGHVRHHGRGELVIGPSASSEAIAAKLSAAQVPTQVSPDVAAALWEKLIINCALNALSAITYLPYGEIVRRPGAPEVIRDLVTECLAVAQACGVTLRADAHAAVQRVVDAMPGQRSSTAQDLRAGKPSEIDHINGYVVRMGAAMKVATPANRALHTLVRMLEPG
jgi:2-dehydropantoate 2-reductase